MIAIRQIEFEAKVLGAAAPPNFNACMKACFTTVITPVFNFISDLIRRCGTLAIAFYTDGVVSRNQKRPDKVGASEAIPIAICEFPHWLRTRTALRWIPICYPRNDDMEDHKVTISNTVTAMLKSWFPEDGSRSWENGVVFRHADHLKLWCSLKNVEAKFTAAERHSIAVAVLGDVVEKENKADALACLKKWLFESEEGLALRDLVPTVSVEKAPESGESEEQQTNHGNASARAWRGPDSWNASSCDEPWRGMAPTERVVRRIVAPRWNSSPGNPGFTMSGKFV